MFNDTGLIIGTFIVFVFGLGIAIGLPMLIERQGNDAELPFERKTAVRWIRIMGWILAGVSGAELILLWVL